MSTPPLPLSPDLTADQIEALVGQRHPTTGIEFPAAGLLPYHDWLIRTLHRLAECSLGALRVEPARTDELSVVITRGRATIADTPVTLDDTTLDLALFNNDTVLLALVLDTGSGPLVIRRLDEGWPSGPHLKLAEVVLVAGGIETVWDRRLETVFRV